MGIKKFVKYSNVLLNKLYQQQGLHQQVRCFSKGKKPCKKEVFIEPDYYKNPNFPCKTDEEMKTERSLGQYMRCKVPYKPFPLECMERCFRVSRLDRQLYRPSKSLDRNFKKYWVDCVMEKVPKRRIAMSKPEIGRRPRPEVKCSPKLKCDTVVPLQCRPLRPDPPMSGTRCIKKPLCECPEARKNTLCKIKPKTQATTRRQLTRYPSFSECTHAPLKEDPMTECHNHISICEAWRVFRNRHG